MNKRKKTDEPRDYRRILVLVIGIAMLIASVVTRLYGEGNSGTFVAEATGRIGLLLIALWLAWPSLRRPASWLPPGMAVAGVVTLAVLAARPKIAFIVIPAFIGLLTLSTIVRVFKR